MKNLPLIRVLMRFNDDSWEAYFLDHPVDDRLMGDAKLYGAVVEFNDSVPLSWL